MLSSLARRSGGARSSKVIPGAGLAPRRAFSVAAIALLLGSLVATAGPAHASSYNDTNPGATVCGDGSHTVETARKFYIRMGSSVLARLELRWSDYCDTVWAKVVNLTGCWIWLCLGEIVDLRRDDLRV